MFILTLASVHPDRFIIPTRRSTRHDIQIELNERMLKLTKPEKEPLFAADVAHHSAPDRAETAIIPLQRALPTTETAEEETLVLPGRIERALQFLHQYPKLSVLFSACAIATVSLATWVGALYLENKVLKLRMAQQQQAAQAENAEAIKSRIDEAKNQMTQLQKEMDEQQTDTMLTEQASLAGENARLLQDLNQLSKPQLNAPLVALEAASVRAADPVKKDQPMMIDVPHNHALFTVILQQTQDKGFQSYFVEMTAPKTKGVSWSEKLLKATSLNIPLTFARRAVVAGKYQIKLYGLVGKKKEPIDRYDMQVNYLPDPALKPAKKAAKKKA
jgi:hypothetical protein